MYIGLNIIVNINMNFNINYKTVLTSVSCKYSFITDARKLELQ